MTPAGAATAWPGGEPDYRSLVELATDGIVVTSQEGQFFFANPAALRILGYDSLDDLRALVPNAAALSRHPGERPRMLAALRADLDTLRTVELRRKDGSSVWVEAHGKPVAQADGTMRLHSIFRDLTKEHRERRFANHLAAIVTGSDEAIITKDLAGIVQSWNPGAERLYGYLAAEAIGKPLRDLIYPPGEEGEENRIRVQAAAGHVVPRFETRRRRKDGTIVEVSLCVGPVRNGGGKVVAVSSMAHDITQIKSSAAALRANQQLQTFVLSHMDDVVMTSDVDGRCNYVSPSATKVLGYDTSDLVGRTVALLLHPDDVEATARRRPKGVRRAENGTVSVRLRRKDGAYAWIESRSSPLTDARGGLTGFVAVMRDVTEAHKAAERLATEASRLEGAVRERTAQIQAAYAELDAFTYSVSHDLRSPLRAIDGFARILRDEFAPRLPPDGLHFLDQVLSGTKELAALIDDLLEFSRATRFEPRREAVDVHAMAKEEAARLLALDPGRAVDLAIGPAPPCHADPRLLRHVVNNLLSNAFKFTAKTPDPQVEFGYTAGTQAYFVRDNGAGFDMANADRLFVPFQRLHRAEDYPGTGLGLALVHRIVARHAGRVWANAAPGKGATFWFTMPVSARRTHDPYSRAHFHLPRNSNPKGDPTHDP